MKSDVNQCVSYIDGVKVGQFQSDGLNKCFSFQLVGDFKPLIAYPLCRLPASQKRPRGGTPQLRDPYTPFGVCLTDFREFFSNSIAGDEGRSIKNGAGGLGVSSV